jgi:cyclophilin family peptidyl-prolyl cis-trans isomerase
VVQGGCPQGTGTGGSGKHVKLEVSPTLKHDSAGVLAMARSQNPDSASSQFYFTLAAAPHLDMGYAVFGKVVEGQDVVDKIKKVPTGNKGMYQNVPNEPVVIEKAECIAG